MRWKVPKSFIAGFAAVLASLALTIGGCKSHETPQQQAQAQLDADVASYQEQIRKIVQDPARADRLVALVSDFEKLAHQAASVVRDDQAKLVALNANYNATRADFAALFRQQDADRQALLKKALGLREQMTALTTDSEWEQLKRTREQDLTAMLRELQ
jgi:hypothetical protein